MRSSLEAMCLTSYAQSSQPDGAQSSTSSDTRERRYEFLGDAYIHGIMHGEAWNEADLEEVTLVREPEATLTAPRHNLLAIEHIVRMAILNVRLENSRSN